MKDEKRVFLIQRRNRRTTRSHISGNQGYDSNRVRYADYENTYLLPRFSCGFVSVIIICRHNVLFKEIKNIFMTKRSKIWQEGNMFGGTQLLWAH